MLHTRGWLANGYFFAANFTPCHVASLTHLLLPQEASLGKQKSTPTTTTRIENSVSVANKPCHYLPHYSNGVKWQTKPAPAHTKVNGQNKTSERSVVVVSNSQHNGNSISSNAMSKQIQSHSAIHLGSIRPHTDFRHHPIPHPARRNPLLCVIIT